MLDELRGCAILFIYICNAVFHKHYITPETHSTSLPQSANHSLKLLVKAAIRRSPCSVVNSGSFDLLKYVSQGCMNSLVILHRQIPQHCQWPFLRDFFHQDLPELSADFVSIELCHHGKGQAEILAELSD